METKDILKQLRKSKGLTMEAVAIGADISKSVYPKYESGILNAGVPVIIKLAKFYGVTTDYLLGLEPAPDPFGDFGFCEADEQEVLEKYMSLPQEIRACIMDVMLQLSDAVKSRQPTEAKKADHPTWTVCYSEDAVSAGNGYALDEYERMGKLEVVDTPEARRADFAVKIAGDSMEPSYSDEDIVLVQQVEQIEAGEIGIFFVNGSGYVKEYASDRLISHNPKYEDIILHEYDTMRCFGKVIGVAVLP